MADELLHTYRCSACQTVMTTPAKGLSRCILCRTPMRHLWAQPIETDADRALAARGVVYNPGVKKVIPLCPQCGQRIGLHGVVNDGIRFCSDDCARHYWSVWSEDVTT